MNASPCVINFYARSIKNIIRLILLKQEVRLLKLRSKSELVDL